MGNKLRLSFTLDDLYGNISFAEQNSNALIHDNDMAKRDLAVAAECHLAVSAHGKNGRAVVLLHINPDG